MHVSQLCNKCNFNLFLNEQIEVPRGKGGTKLHHLRGTISTQWQKQADNAFGNAEGRHAQWFPLLQRYKRSRMCPPRAVQCIGGWTQFCSLSLLSVSLGHSKSALVCLELVCPKVCEFWFEFGAETKQKLNIPNSSSFRIWSCPCWSWEEFWLIKKQRFLWNY